MFSRAILLFVVIIGCASAAGQKRFPLLPQELVDLLDIGHVFPETEPHARALEGHLEAMELHLRDTPNVAQCTIQARNQTLFNDNCINVFSKLNSFNGQFSSSGKGGMTSANIDSVCKSSCFQRLILFLQAWQQCLPPTISAPATGAPAMTLPAGSMLNPSFQDGMTQANRMIGMMARMFCLQNADGQYCLSLQLQASTTIATGAGDTTTACNAIKSTGCCTGAFISVVFDMMSSGSIPGMTTLDPATIISQLQDSMQKTCGFTLVMSCDPNPSTAAKLNGVASLSLPWGWWQQQTADKQQQIKNAFCTDLAVAGGFYSNFCSVGSVSQGSSRRAASDGTSFSYQVLGLSSTQLNANKNGIDTNSMVFNDVSAASGQGNVTGSSTVQSVSNSSDASSISVNVVVLLFVSLLSALIIAL